MEQNFKLTKKQVEKLNEWITNQRLKSKGMQEPEGRFRICFTPTSMIMGVEIVDLLLKEFYDITFIE